MPHSRRVSLQNIFDSQEKEGLFTEIDELIFHEDLPVFNRIVFQKGQLFERFLLAGANQGRVHKVENVTLLRETLHQPVLFYVSPWRQQIQTGANHIRYKQEVTEYIQ